MKKVFIDTSGWISILVKTDVNYTKGVEYYRHLLEAKTLLITSNYIIDETITRIRYDISHAKAVKFLDLITIAEANGFLEISWVDRACYDDSLKIFKKYSDQEFSFTDCTSFAIMKSKNANEVFGFDKHFLMFGIEIKP